MTRTDNPLIHRFDTLESSLPIPEKFNNPFRYTPPTVTAEAAKAVLGHISSSDRLVQVFSEGKMLGVLVVRDSAGGIGFLAGFSGLAGGRSMLPYFVPPVLDLTDPSGYFRQEEARINGIGTSIKEAEENPEFRAAIRNAEAVKAGCEEKIRQWKKRMTESKARRDALRLSGADKTTLASLIKESQFEKAQLKRISAECKAAMEDAESECRKFSDRIAALKRMRQEKSEELQEWISRNMVVENALGEKKSVWEIFSGEGLVPPGGTGECAAPKLLHYAYTHRLEPVAMGEFWYGKSLGNEVRQHGRFYPSCKGKCGPLLGFMLQGLDVETEHPEPFSGTVNRSDAVPAIIYEDSDIIAVDKPSGMLSAPGKTGEKSLQELLSEKLGISLFGVHRLDMDTSGVIVFAKNPDAQKNLQRQFETGEVRKEYTALLDTAGNGTPDAAVGLSETWKSAAAGYGTISLPLAPDYHDRPRQKVDFKHGKKAVTEYNITGTGEGWAKVLFRPLTGRTHQLRVHAAHPLGLDSPIKGDRLYGSADSACRLCLHASRIKFRHPVTGLPVELASNPEFQEFLERYRNFM